LNAFALGIATEIAQRYNGRMSTMDYQIRPARSESDLQAVARLFEAYAASLAIDLAYQNFTAEVSALPGKYASPAGEILLAETINGDVMGCVALRPFNAEGCCEMKRLYIAPEGRGIGLGRALVAAILQEARRIGYREMYLDTLPTMTSAIALYRTAGFQSVEAYYDTPIPNTLFFACALEGFNTAASSVPNEKSLLGTQTPSDSLAI
jgi:N-acetylglutamate synthase-like GNAT family acetyltransferase